MIAVNDLSFAYGDGDFSLRIDAMKVAAGEKLAIIGPSGSGKTTLLYLLAGIIPAGPGMVRVDDTDIGTLGDAARRAFRARHIGFVFQDFALLDYLNVYDNIVHAYRIVPQLTLDGRVADHAKDLAERVGLAGKLRRSITTLSQGERQRVALCRALLPAPPLLLADEVTGTLDPANKARILDVLFDQAEAQSATVVAVTHDHALLDRFDRTIDFADLAAVSVS